MTPVSLAPPALWGFGASKISQRRGVSHQKSGWWTSEARVQLPQL